MAKNSSKKHQRLYRMKGCSKKTKTSKNYLGGSADVNLAYPATDVKFVPNPFLAYTGKGGALEDKAFPNQGPPPGGINFLNPQDNKLGGGCGCGTRIIHEPRLCSDANCRKVSIYRLTR